VYWIAVQERFHDLALATYGRGFWILDDLTPLQHLTPEILASNAHLFAPRDAYRFRSVAEPAAVSYDPTAGHNPTYGASINFYLKSKPGEKERVRLTISDAGGKDVREIECHAAREGGARRAGLGGPGGDEAAEAGPPCEVKAGINRYFWNLRSEPSEEMKLRTSPLYAPDVKVGPEGWRSAPGAGRISLLEPPGTYTVTLTVGEQKFSQKLNVLKDPHSTGTEGDIHMQMEFLTGLRNEMNALAASVNQIESIRAQLLTLEAQLGADDTGKAIRKAADDLSEKLVAEESKVLQLKLTGRGQDGTRWPPMLASKVNYLANEAGSSDFAPTTQQVAVAQALKQRGDQFQQEYQEIMAKDVTPFNAMLREKNIPNIILKAP
jgi:hypothetical protein